MADINDRDDALAAIADIARTHGLTVEDIAAFLSRGQVQPHRKTEILTKLFGYLGGVLIFAGLVIYAGMQWDGMGSAERIAITLGPGIIAYVLAIACLRDPRYIRAATPLFLIAGLLQPSGMMVAIAELSHGGDERHALLVVFAIMAVSFGFTFWREQRATLLFLLLIYVSSWFAVFFDLMGLEDDYNALVVGFFLTAVTYGISKTRYRTISGFWYFVGSAILLAASFDILERSPFDVLFLGLACFLMFVSLVVRSRALLLNGTLGVLFFIGYYTSEYFADVGGWPLALLVMGLVLIGMSKVALELNRRYILAGRAETQGRQASSE